MAGSSLHAAVTPLGVPEVECERIHYGMGYVGIRCRSNDGLKLFVLAHGSYAAEFSAARQWHRAGLDFCGTCDKTKPQRFFSYAHAMQKVLWETRLGLSQESVWDSFMMRKIAWTLEQQNRHCVEVVRGEALVSSTKRVT